MKRIFVTMFRKKLTLNCEFCIRARTVSCLWKWKTDTLAVFLSSGHYHLDFLLHPLAIRKAAHCIVDRLPRLSPPAHFPPPPGYSPLQLVLLRPTVLPKIHLDPDWLFFRLCWALPCLLALLRELVWTMWPKLPLAGGLALLAAPRSTDQWRSIFQRKLVPHVVRACRWLAVFLGPFAGTQRESPTFLRLVPTESGGGRWYCAACAPLFFRCRWNSA